MLDGPHRRTAVALMAALLAVLVATPAEGKRKATMSPRPSDAVEVFRCGFDEPWDINYDGWPDRWTRLEAPDYPHYVEMKIAEDAGAASKRCLQIHLDGAQALVSSPPIRVVPKFSYRVDLKLKVENAPQSRVFVRLEYQNADGEVRQSQRTEPIDASGRWISVEIDPLRPKYADVDRAMIRVETERGRHGDLDGVVSIADLSIGRLPSLDVVANNPYHVYTDPRGVVIRCSLSGIRERNPNIRFQLLDATSHKIGSLGRQQLNGREIREEKLTQKLIQEETRSAAEIVDGMGNHAAGFEGETEWRPDIREPGFYQVHVEMLSSETGDTMDSRTVTLAVIPPLAIEPGRGEFGWSLPHADQPLSFEALEEVLPLVGINWMKLPIWFPAEKIERGEQIIQFAERLAASDIETIGVIQHPDLIDYDDETALESRASYDVANVFGGDPSRWLPLYDHIMTRLSLRIRWWQLGADRDTSFVGYEDLIQQISQIRQQLYRFGQDVGLGLGWRWDTPLLEETLSWEFQQMAADPPLNAAGLDAALAKPTSNPAKRWVLIEPVIDEAMLTTEDERHVARVRELVKQIVNAKRHGADGIFTPDPFTGPHGLMTPEGKPGELLLPWRTSATLLGGAGYLGKLQLPEGSENWLFRRADGVVVMVVWNDEPVVESLYLGDDVSVFDVWGKQSKPSRAARRDQIRVGPMPHFVVGLHESIARWRMAVRFEKQRVPSIFGQEHTNALMLRNGFSQGVGGGVSLFVPDRLRAWRKGEPQASEQWRITTAAEDFSIGAGQDYTLPMEIRLTGAAVGDQPVRIDFDLEADRADKRYKFSVWRSLAVGLGDVRVNVRSQFDERGRLIVHQQMTNTSGTPMSFKCYLHVKGRRRKRAQVFQLGPEPDIKEYVYPRGNELVGGEIKLRVEEIDGPRVLIQRFIATE